MRCTVPPDHNPPPVPLRPPLLPNRMPYLLCGASASSSVTTPDLPSTPSNHSMSLGRSRAKSPRGGAAPPMRRTCRTCHSGCAISAVVAAAAVVVAAAGQGPGMGSARVENPAVENPRGVHGRVVCHVGQATACNATPIGPTAPGRRNGMADEWRQPNAGRSGGARGTAAAGGADAAATACPLGVGCVRRGAAPTLPSSRAHVAAAPAAALRLPVSSVFSTCGGAGRPGGEVRAARRKAGRSPGFAQ
eukprot:257402-Chlamydomonas_euryale.AAC.1